LKKILAVSLIAFFFLVAVGGTAFLNSEEIPTFLLQEITSEYRNDGGVISLEDDELLRQALKKQNVEDELPESLVRHEPPYQLKLHYTFGMERMYDLYFDKDERVWLFNQKKNSVLSLDDPIFFHTHEEFRKHISEEIPTESMGLVTEEGSIEITPESHTVKGYNEGWFDLPTEEPRERMIIREENQSMELQGLSEEIKGSYEISGIGTREKEIGFKGEIEEGVLSLPKENGEYLYHLRLRKEGASGYEYEQQLTFSISIQRPPRLELEKRVVEQDELIMGRVFNVSSLRDFSIEGELKDQIRYYEKDNFIRLFLPTNYHTPVGENTITLIDKENEEEQQEYQIMIEPREYLTQHLRIDPGIEAATRNEEAYAESARYYRPVFLESSGEKYYEEDFILPVGGRLTTEFGEKRRVNDQMTSYRHNGIDIAAPLGTEVKATNNGRVVLSREFIMQGNTIIIDHGWGLLSVYLHLNHLEAEEGEMVDKGQVIGTVGSTGFSTGPHLHFTISYFNTPLEPGYFIQGRPYRKSEGIHLLP